MDIYLWDNCGTVNAKNDLNSAMRSAFIVIESYDKLLVFNGIVPPVSQNGHCG